LCKTLRGTLAELEPGVFSQGSAAALAEELALTQNACAAAKARLAAHAARSGMHRERGHADASDWIAAVEGTTTRVARQELETVARLEQCPETRDALYAGKLSLAQAAEIARTEALVPGSEPELLHLARSASLGAVRDHARATRLEAMDREELHANQRAAREFSHWRDDMGMVCGRFALTPEVGLPLVDRIDAETDRLRREMLREEAGPAEREPRARLAADAFVAVVEGSARAGAGARGAVLNLVVDWPALARGHVHDGERCHLVGGGPIPVRIARELAANAFVKVVLTDGVEVQRVAHLGRRMRAELRTALELGPPPQFGGVTCAEQGCERRYGLEWDHIEPVARGGQTSLANLQPLCGPHHGQKTRLDAREPKVARAP
jgi:hypothetical protein